MRRKDTSSLHPMGATRFRRPDALPQTRREPTQETGAPRWPVSTAQYSYWALCLVLFGFPPTTRGRRSYYTTDRMRMQGSQCRHGRKCKGFNTLALNQPESMKGCPTRVPKRRAGRTTTFLCRRKRRTLSTILLAFAAAQVRLKSPNRVSPPFKRKGARRDAIALGGLWSPVLPGGDPGSCEPPQSLLTIQECRKRPR